MSDLSEFALYQHKRGPRLLTGSITATLMQMLNNFVLSSCRLAWNRGNELSLKRTGVHAFYQDDLIVFYVKWCIRILACWTQMYWFWFLSEMVCPGNLGNKSHTFVGGYIIIPISKLALWVYVVMMSNPVSYLFAERTCFWQLPSSRGVWEAPRGCRYVQWN